jgi:hypothetical protein
MREILTRIDAQDRAMPDYTAIEDVGITIIDLLRENMNDLILPDSIVWLLRGKSRTERARLFWLLLE